MTDNRLMAVAQVWGKGYRVSQRSEEFQLLIPPSEGELAASEKLLLTVPSWGALLSGLYKLRPSAISRQFGFLVDETGILVVGAAHSSDNFDRKSVVVIGCAAELDWDNPEDDWKAGAVRSLASRLAATYGETLKGGLEEYKAQLRDGRFLPNREFVLEQTNSTSEGPDWHQLIAEVRRWQGVTGVATAHFMPLGANVFCGTRDELERARTAHPIDGFMDLARGEIEALTDKLTHWPTKPVAERNGPKDVHEKLDSLAEQQDRIERRQESLLEMFQRMMENILK